MNYKRIIRPSEIQKEWERKTKRQSIWTKQRHIPPQVTIILITIALVLIFNYRAVIAAYILKFTYENNINLPEPLFNFLMKTIAEYLRDNNLLYLLHK